MKNAFSSSQLPPSSRITASRAHVDSGSSASVHLNENPRYSAHPVPKTGCSAEPYGVSERMRREEPDHAALIIPLRDRDMKELKALFTDREIEAIETDIMNNLLWRFPEPCWEDDPFEFLQEYL